MATNKLRLYFGISIPLFIAHGLEEYINGFYEVDSHSKFLLNPFLSIADYQTSFLTFQILFWTFLIVVFFINKILPKWFSLFIALVYIYELHHLVKAFSAGGYYPGLVSALTLYVIGYLFLKELIKDGRVKLNPSSNIVH
ncbi:MAG TPA: HXXEE domain-containing protein [Candidatus Paceibacterota bacterium]